MGLKSFRRMKILSDRILIKEAPLETKRSSGLFIPQNKEKEQAIKGIVEAVGPGKDAPVSVKQGDEILYSKFAGTPVTVNEVDYILLRESDILVIL